MIRLPILFPYTLLFLLNVKIFATGRKKIKACLSSNSGDAAQSALH